MTPSEKLRVELERLRDRDYTFSMAWPAAVNAALRDEHVEATVLWRGKFSEQRRVWQVSYSRTPWPVHWRPALTELDDERNAPARPTGAAPVLA